MIRHITAAALVAVLIAAGWGLQSRDVTSSPLFLDQHLDPEPACSDFNGSKSSPAPQRQEFVPTLNQLTNVQLCVSASDGVPISIGICEGHANEFCDYLATGTGTTSVAGDEWIDVPLDAPLLVTPGTMYVIEAPNSSAWAWKGTCSMIVGSCTQVDDDLYPAGEPDGSSLGAVILDFAFRTYGNTVATPTASPTPTATPTAGPSPSPTVSPSTASPAPTPTASPTPSTSPTSGTTPTAGPVPSQLIWGDFDCSGATGLEDGGYLLGAFAGLSPPTPPDCPELFQNVTVDGFPQVWGDLDCFAPTGLVDVIDLFLHLAGLTYLRAPGCPAPDMAVSVTYSG